MSIKKYKSGNNYFPIYAYRLYFTKNQLFQTLLLMKKKQHNIRKSFAVIVGLLVMTQALFAIDIKEAGNQISLFRQQIKGLNEENRQEWQSAKDSEMLDEQTPFESDLHFMQRYLDNSSKLWWGQYQKKSVIYSQITDLLGWNFQTRSMELVLDVNEYDANNSIWQISIKHQDWPADGLKYDLAITPDKAEELYNDRENVRIFGDVVFDLWNNPHLNQIFISSEAAGLDTTLTMGALSEYDFPTPVTALTFINNNNQLLAGCKDKSMHLIDLASIKENKPLRVYSDINAIRKLPYKNHAVLALNDGYLRIFDLGTQKEIWQKRHFGNLEGLALSVDGRFACCASTDNRMRVYDLETKKQMLELEYPYGIKACDISFQGDFLAYGTEHGYSELFEYAVVRIFAIGETSPDIQIASNGEVESVRFSPDGTLLLYSDSEGTSGIIDISSKSKLITFDKAYRAEWLRGEDLIIGIGKSKELNIIEAKTGDVIKAIQHHEKIICFALAEGGNYVAIGSSQGVYIYKL